MSRSRHVTTKSPGFSPISFLEHIHSEKSTEAFEREKGTLAKARH